jgi:hypothetical protein
MHALLATEVECFLRRATAIGVAGRTLIMLASLQRYVRAPQPDPACLDRTPLPDALAGRISRRRIAEVLGIPLETVRRQVDLLIRPRASARIGPRATLPHRPACLRCLPKGHPARSNARRVAEGAKNFAAQIGKGVVRLSYKS